MQHLLTLEQARFCLDFHGITVADFARDHDLSAPIVYQVLKGKKIGKYGQSHRAACLLGIKRGAISPVISLPKPSPSSQLHQ